MAKLFIRFIGGAALMIAGIAIGLYFESGDLAVSALRDLKNMGQGPESRAIGEVSAATGDTTELQLRYRSGPFRIGTAVIPDIPSMGENEIRVMVADAAGDPVSGARIEATAEMAAMGNMPAMQAGAKMDELRPGIYRGVIELPANGSWVLALDVEKAEVGETRLTLEMATGRAGVHLAGGGVPIAAEDRMLPSSGEGDGLPYRAGPYRFDLALEPETPRVGRNTLILRLMNADSEPTSEATLAAVAEMPAMGQMPAMRATAEMTEVEPGIYRGVLELPMQGAWPLSLAIRAPNLAERRVSFDMATGRPGLRPASGISTAMNARAAFAKEAPPGTITLDTRRRQLIGVTSDVAKITDMTRTIRAVGQITFDETRLADVTLKFNAWVGKMHVDYVGAKVEKGQPLFAVYSPELLGTQQEYLELQARAGRSDVGKTLLAAARKRLTLWNMGKKEIGALDRRGVPQDYVTIHAPRTGTVITKNVVDGTARKAGTTLMRIADLSQVWLEAEIYESELPLVREGMNAEISMPYMPNVRLTGTVDYIYPYLKGESRTGRIRLVLANPKGVLKPDMYAEVKLKADLGKRLTVPEEAVIISGKTRVVFEDLGDGRLAPRIVETGQRAEGRIEIVSGLTPGAEIVTSGNFLIASESRLKAAIKQW